jgi:cyanophycin synthetase
MEIIKLQVLNGSNIWSTQRKKLIQMRLDIGELEFRPTNTIEGFSERIKSLIPTLYSHRCSEGEPGGFFSRVESGTWIGHVIEHIALELQCLAGMETGFGRTRETNISGIYNVVFSYIDQDAGLYAARVSVDIAQALINGTPYFINDDIDNLKTIFQKNQLGPSTNSIVQEAAARNIPYFRLNNHSLIQLGYGANQRRIEATVTDETSYLGVGTACNKELTKELLMQSGIPVPEGKVCVNEEQMLQTIKNLGFPIVIKPLDGNHGKGATINITDLQEARSAFMHAKEYGEQVIVEKFIVGSDFRILVVNHKVVAAAKRIPAHVIGNGINSIMELIEQVNADPRRGEGHDNVLTKIVVDIDTIGILEKNNLTLESIPLKNVFIQLKSTANLSTGATSEDVTDTLHLSNCLMAEQISRIIGLDICGIDIMAPDLHLPLSQNTGVILEVNAAPGFRMHVAPDVGKSRNVAAAVVDMLFPEDKSPRIPIVAVTGTNGKTTTSRLISFMASNAGYCTGLTTSDGIYVNSQLIEKGDTTGPQSAHKVLKNPSVEFAVLETARGGILRSGLGYDQCNIGIITNISEDHLGMNDINTLDDLANVKSVVLESICKDGWAVINADDSYCIKIASDVECNKAYFSLNPENEDVQNLILSGAPVAVLNGADIEIFRDTNLIFSSNAALMPLTLGAQALFMVQNVLAASLSGLLSGFSTESIITSLRTFTPDSKNTPGRMNVFQFNNCWLMVDYAHNPAGFKAVADFMKQVNVTSKTGIIAGVGNRRNEDIIACGSISAEMFDHIIIRQDKDLRGRSEQEITQLLLEGITAKSSAVTYEVISNEKQAILHALSSAPEDSCIVAFCDSVEDVIDYVEYLQNSFKASKLTVKEAV